MGTTFTGRHRVSAGVILTSIAVDSTAPSGGVVGVILTSIAVDSTAPSGGVVVATMVEAAGARVVGAAAEGADWLELAPEVFGVARWPAWLRVLGFGAAAVWPLPSASVCARPSSSLLSSVPGFGFGRRVLEMALRLTPMTRFLPLSPSFTGCTG